MSDDLSNVLFAILLTIVALRLVRQLITQRRDSSAVH